jgi:hypothetical protein
MKQILTTVVLASLSLLLIRCDIEETPAKKLGSFNRIQSNGMVTFNLVTGAENAVISTSIMESMYSVSGGTLIVNAAGGSMTVAIRDLKMLSCNACSIGCPEPLIADTLNMYVHAGSVDLGDIQINGFLGLNAVNTGKYKFTGRASFFQVSSSNLATIKAFDLVTDSTDVNSSSISEVEVNTTKVVNVFINSMGDVLYRGNPPIVRLSKSGTGRLIKK